MLLQKLATTTAVAQKYILGTYTAYDMSVTAPTSDYWRDFSVEPEDFDAEKVWKYTSKYVSSKGSPRWGCPWCLKKFLVSTRPRRSSTRQRLLDKKIAPYLGAFNGTQPTWLTASLRALIVRKKALSAKKVQVRVALHV